MSEDRKISAPKPARRRRDVSGFGPAGHHPAEAIIAEWEKPVPAPETDEPIELTVHLIEPDPETTSITFETTTEPVVDVDIILPERS